MRMRLTCLLAICALVCFPRLSARAQSDTALKLSTTVPQAIAEFRAGLVDLENISSDASAAHFQAAVKADPNFGLARVLYVFNAATLGGGLTESQVNAELNRGVADAATRGNVNELLLAAAYREAFRNQGAAAVIARAASQLMPGDRLIAASALGFPAFSSDQILGLARFHPRTIRTYALPYNTLAYSLRSRGSTRGARGREAAGRAQSKCSQSARYFRRDPAVGWKVSGGDSRISPRDDDAAPFPRIVCGTRRSGSAPGAMIRQELT